MKKAIISLSFDDGRGDNLDVFRNILIPMSIPATINVTAGYVDGTCPEHLSPSPKKAMTVDEVIALAQNPLVEIAAHGDCHLNTAEDIAAGRAKLIRWLGLADSDQLGFASPGSGLKVGMFLNNRTQLFQEQISYLRTSLRIQRHYWLRTLCRKAGRVIHIPMLYKIAYADTLMDCCRNRVIYSIPVMKDTTFGQIKAIVDLAIKRRCGLTLMFHSILANTDGEDNWSWKKRDFVKLCEYLKKRTDDGSLEVMTTQNLFRSLQG